MGCPAAPTSSRAGPFAKHESLAGYFDVGGFGAASDVTCQATAGVNWQFSRTFAAKVGNRYFCQDYENDGFVWDMAAHGACLGLGIGFSLAYPPYSPPEALD